jgi:Putative zinc-finger
MHLNAEQLDRYIRKEVSQDERRIFSAHLATCAECRSQLTRIPAFQQAARAGIADLTRSRVVRLTPAVGEDRLAKDLKRTLLPSSELDHDDPEPARSPLRPWAVGLAVAGIVCSLLLLGYLLRSSFASQSPLGDLPTDVLAVVQPAWTQLSQQQQLVFSKEINDLGEQPTTLLGPADRSPGYSVISPVRTFVATTTPEFHWSTRAGATSYQVTVVADDRSNAEVANSGPLPAQQTTWRVPEQQQLKAGNRYRWYVTALVNNEEVDSPGLEQPRAKFGVLNLSDTNDFHHWQTETKTPLARALLAIHFGLFDDARRELERLTKDPQTTGETSSAAEAALRQIEAFQGSSFH